MQRSMKIKKGDKVKVMRGKDAGKTGNVLKVLPSLERVVVDGANAVKRRRKPKRRGEKGQIVEVYAPMDSSNVMLVCSKCSKTARIGYEVNDAGKKVRKCKKCGEYV